MEDDDLKYIKTTETCQTISNYLVGASLAFLIMSEFGITSSFFNWSPSPTVSVVLAVTALTYRVIAIDRFLRMARQKDMESR